MPPNILDSLRTEGEEDAVWCVAQGYQSSRVCGCKRRLVISQEYSAISKANIFDTLEMDLGIQYPHWCRQTLEFEADFGDVGLANNAEVRGVRKKTRKF